MLKQMLKRLISPLAGCCFVVFLTVASWVIGFITGKSNQSDVGLDLSPDGRHLLFASSGKAYENLYALDRVTHQVMQLTKTREFSSYPRYSKDGSLIAYGANTKVGQAAHIYVCRSDGSQIRQITDGEYYDLMPSFSHDGKSLVFTRAHRHRPYSFGGYTWDQYDLYTLNLDGSHLRRITNRNYNQASSPSFSLDGKVVLFGAYLGQENGFQVCTVTLEEGAVPKAITQGSSHSSPTYSPDGLEIIYVSDSMIPYEYEVHKMNADGSNARQLTENHSYNLRPRYSPDSRHILFMSDPRREQRFDLWEMDADGAHPHLVADSRLFDDPLHWKPGKQSGR
jgi:Tol biopolymer transport system component